MNPADGQSGTGGLGAKLAALEAMFLTRLPDRLAEIRAALAAAQSGAHAPAARADLHRLLHSLAGTAGTFGFPALGEKARALEMALAALKGDGIDDERMGALLPALEEFLASAAGLGKPEAQPGIALDEPAAPALAPETDVDADGAMQVYLLARQAPLAQDMIAQLQHFGCVVTQFDRHATLAARVSVQAPAVVLIECGSQAELDEACAAIAPLRTAAGRALPVVFVSSLPGFEARLQAVRAGADGYFPIPVDVVALSHRLDALSSRAREVPIRILLVDDDEVGAEYHAAVLRGAGMEMRALTQPHDILAVLGEYRPELILMDVYMPNYSGIELVQMIRQDNTYLDVPIVFLSSEMDPAKQLEAIQSGADDFLVKPILPAHLVSAITTRAKRYRTLRGLIMRDSLTGLFNHSATKEHLMREIARARRARLPLSLAMLDLDFFKKVNDSYGHMTGDQVLRALSRLLQQWMRRSDIVGRYGGEEFVVVLPGTTAEAAMGVLDNVRQAFAKVRHHAEGQEFTVTLSAGVAELDSSRDADSLFKAADDALYRAKHAGRNRVERG